MRIIAGFLYLSGKECNVFFSGHLAAEIESADVPYVKVERQTVSGSGEIEAPDAFYGDITVGLFYETVIKTLPISFEVAAASRGMQKNVSKVYIRAGGEGTVSVSPAENNKPVPMQLTPTPQDSIPPMKEVPIMGDWDDDACLTIRHDYSGGFTLQSMVIEVAGGG